MPTLVDTSVWVAHFRTHSITLPGLLDNDLVLCHPLIVGELACGNLKHRSEVLESLIELPMAPTIEFGEVRAFIEAHKLYGQGLGWIDAHLLASSLLEGATLWTLDQSLRRAAKRLHCSFEAFS